MSRLAAEVGMPPFQKEDLRTVPALRALVELSRAEIAEREARDSQAQEALAILERVLNVRHADNADFPPLAECHAKAQSLWREITHGRVAAAGPEVTALRQGTHPLALFLHLLETADSDDRYWDVLNGVAASLGPPIALAASLR